MPNNYRIDRPTSLHISLPVSLRARLDLHLYSGLEGRIPKGAYQTFISERIREYFARLDQTKETVE